MNFLHSIFTRNQQRESLASQLEAIIGTPATPGQLDLLADGLWGDVALELLKMGVATDDLDDALTSARVVAECADCSPMYAAQFVANVRIFTDAPLAAPMLAQWLKPEVHR